MPEFSIILPVGNGAGFSSRAVGSILSQRVDAEILWVSEFNPKELGVESKTVQWLFQKNTGIAEARNLGPENASGNWLGFLDADDCYTPNALNSLKENLSQIWIVIWFMVGPNMIFCNPNGEISIGQVHLIRSQILY